MTARTKKIFRIVGLSFAFIFLLLVFVIWRIGSIVEGSINTAIPAFLGVPASVEAVDVSVLSGKVHIKHLEIGNPDGYDTPYMFHMDSLNLDIALCELFKKRVHIRQIHIIGPHIWYHQKLTANNISDFLKQLPGGGGKSDNAPSDDKKQEKAESMAVIIDHFLLDEGTLGVKAGIGLEIPLAKVELFDVGKDGAFVPLQAVRVLISAIFDSVVHAVSAVGGAALKGAGAVGGAALDAAGAVGGAALDAAGAVGGAALDAAGAVGGATLKGAGKVVKGIGSLFSSDSESTNSISAEEKK